MHILWTLVVGFLVGLVAKLLMPGRAPSGFIITIILGIAGAFLAEWIGQQLNFYAEGQPAGFVASVIGAMILLFFYGVFTKNRNTTV